MCSCLYFKIKRVNLYNNVYVFVYVQCFKIKRVDLYTNILCSCMYSILKIKCVILYTYFLCTFQLVLYFVFVLLFFHSDYFDF